MHAELHISSEVPRIHRQLAGGGGELHSLVRWSRGDGKGRREDGRTKRHLHKSKQVFFLKIIGVEHGGLTELVGP